MAESIKSSSNEAVSVGTGPTPDADRSIRPVIEHALTVYYDGNRELANTLIDMLLAEKAGE
jgi:hypothetical protein